MRGKTTADQAIFEERAKELAKIFSEKTNDVSDALLVFCLGEGRDEKYALSYQYIERVIPLGHLTVVPMASELFLGVTYHNAQIWPVIDTEVLLHFRVEKIQPEYVILIREENYRYALAVRYIVGHIDHKKTQSLTQLAGNDAQKNHYILGMCYSDIALIDEKAVFEAIKHVFSK